MHIALQIRNFHKLCCKKEKYVHYRNGINCHNTLEKQSFKSPSCQESIISLTVFPVNSQISPKVEGTICSIMLPSDNPQAAVAHESK